MSTESIITSPEREIAGVDERTSLKLAAALTERDPAIEFNIEGNPFSGPRSSDRDGVSDTFVLKLN